MRDPAEEYPDRKPEPYSNYGVIIERLEAEVADLKLKLDVSQETKVFYLQQQNKAELKVRELVEKAYKEAISEFDKGAEQWWWERSNARRGLGL